MENTIRQILNKPDAPLILEELKEILMKEAERRKEFRDWIDDSMKAEFINGEAPYQYIIDDDIESRVIKGFRVPVRAIFEEQANVSALQVLVK